MNYSDGQEIRLWDRVELLGSDTVHGVVVFSIDTDEYSAQYPREHWSYLGRGVMVATDKIRLVHYDTPAEELRLVSRGQPWMPER